MPAPLTPEGPGDQRCSARGCAAGARWALRWNNPKIHQPERRKTWLACDDHADHLASFLSVRGMLRERTALTGDVDVDGDIETRPAT